MSNSESSSDQRRDKLLLRLLKTPPQSRVEVAEAARRAKEEKRLTMSRAKRATLSNAPVGLRVFEALPLVSEKFDDRQYTQTPQIGPEELACMRRTPLASEEFDIPSDAPVVRIVGKTSSGSYMLAVSPTPPIKSSALPA